jgi:hypothetical protein
MSGRVLHRGNMESLLKNVTRRIDEVERRSTLPGSSIREGTFTVLDDSGQVRALIGELPDGSYGIRIVGPNGEKVAEFNHQGINAPYQIVPMISSGTTLLITMDQNTFPVNTTNNGCWLGDIWVAGKYMRVDVIYGITAGSTIALELGIQGSGDPGITQIDQVSGLTASGISQLDGDVSAFMGRWCRVFVRGARTAGAGACTFKLTSHASIQPV